MNLPIQSALISVYNKDGLAPLIQRLQQSNVSIYSTGGTQKFIAEQGANCHTVEGLTGFPSILGGRVKTLHPHVFGGILARRNQASDLEQLSEYGIPLMDLVVVDLYPFEETLANTKDEKEIIEKIDIGGVSLLRAAAKNYQDVCVISSKADYAELVQLLNAQEGTVNLNQRKEFAAKAFAVCAQYDMAIANYFNTQPAENSNEKVLRYGENPHQQAVFYGNIDEWFKQLNGKEISYNNLVDIDAACQLIAEFDNTTFAIIKHTNVCGIATRPTVKEAWKAALAGDPESAFGGVLICNQTIDEETAIEINKLFFEILIAPDYTDSAAKLLKSKKNRIVLRQLKKWIPRQQQRNILAGSLVQDADEINHQNWNSVGARTATALEEADLIFANIVCKHLKSNAIALVKNLQLVGKGCGQTSRIDALRHAVDKAKHLGYHLQGAVMASDAFFPFDDCIRMAKEQGVVAVIQPGGSVRDSDTINFAKEHDMVLVMTGTRHFRH